MKNTNNKQLDVLLCMAPPFAPSMPPIGLGYLNSYLKSKDIKTDIYDINIELYNKLSPEKKSLWQFDISNLWGEIETVDSVCKPACREKIVDGILERNPSFVGFSINSANKFFTQLLISSIRKRKIDVTIVLGGPGCYYQTDRDFFPDGFVDAFIVGEGEFSFYELLQAKLKGIGMAEVEGVFIPSQPEKFKSRTLIQDLDVLPYPDIADFNMSDYSAQALPVMFSRGCVNRCAFCSDHLVWNNSYRSRSAESVIAEIENSSKKTGIKDIVFYDLTINGNLKELESFCDILVKKGSDFTFTANICVRKDMDLSLFSKMKKSGFFALYFGVESGSDNVLKAMKKNFTASVAHANLSDSNKAGILNYVNFIVGFPGEKDEDFAETIAFLNKSAGNLAGVNNVNACHLVANTYIFEHYKELNIEKHTSPAWFEAENTLEKRTENVKILLDVAKENNKRIFNHGFISEHVDVPDMSIESLSKDACVIIAPYASVSVPDYHTARMLDILKKCEVGFDLLDLNMNLYQNVSEKRRDFWQQHKVLDWSNIDTCRDIFNSLNVLDFKDYFDHMKDSKYFIFPVTVFNAESVKIITEFISSNYPDKKILLVPDYKFSDFKNMKSDDKYVVFSEGEFLEFFNKNKGREVKNIAPDYTSFRTDLYADFILEFNGFDGVIEKISDTEKQKNTLLLKKLNPKNTSIATSFKWATYVGENDVLNEDVLSGVEFVIVKISSDLDIRKNIDKNICGLKKAVQILRWCDDRNIKVFLEILVGIPGETKEKFIELLTFVKENINMVSAVYRADKFIPDTDFLKTLNDAEIQLSKKDAVPVAWVDKYGSNDYLRSVRLYFLTKELNAVGKEPKYTNINYSYSASETESAIAEILSYKNKEVIDLNKEKRALAAELNAVADSRVKAVVLEKDKAVEEMAEKNKDNFAQWEAKFIKEISKRDKQLEDLFCTKDSLNNIIDNLEQENNLVKQSWGYRLEIFLTKVMRKVFFLKDR